MASKNHPNGYWSIERIRAEASKFKSRSEFKKHASAGYSAAQDKGILDTVCMHLPKRKRTLRTWPPDRVARVAKKYPTRKTFQLGSPGAYRAALRLGIIDSVSLHMVRSRVPKGHWTIDLINAAAKKYKSRAAFRKYAPAAFAAAWKHGMIDSVSGHMKALRRPDWSPEQIAQEAKKFTSRSEFERRSLGAYKAAHRRKLLDEVCAHMHPKGHRYKRALYIYEFGDKSVYVGLTYDYERRHRQHMSGSKRIIEKARQFGYRLIRENEWLLPEKAAREEAKQLRSYSSRGWEVINFSKAGSLGGSLHKWTPATLCVEVRKYRTLAEFKQHSRGAYHAAWKTGILDSLCAGLKRTKQPNGKWTRAAVLREAKKYRTRNEFLANAGGAYHAARRFELMKQACAHMRQFTLPKGSWTQAKILKSARTCGDRTQFQREFPGAYDAAIRLRLLPQIHRMIPRRRREPFWTDDRLISEAKKYSTRMDFKTHAPSAYVIAGRKGIRDKVCSHMV